jgi:hypothetical protein
LRKGDGNEEDRALCAFARKLTLAAYSVADEEMAALIKKYGPEKVVAMVHTVAHANFQCRIFLALRVRVEDGGPFPPLDVRPAAKAKATAPSRPPWKTVATARARPDAKFRPGWRPLTIEQAEAALEEQKARKPRLAPKKDGRINWSAVSMGHQPRLTGAWFETMSAASKERSIDPVFGNSYFWVITRTTECFY